MMRRKAGLPRRGAGRERRRQDSREG